MRILGIVRLSFKGRAVASINGSNVATMTWSVKDQQLKYDNRTDSNINSISPGVVKNKVIHSDETASHRLPQKGFASNS